MHGVGPVQARKWISDGIDSVEKLLAAVKAGGVSLTREQQLGVQYRDALKARVPRAEVARHEELLHRLCAKVDPDLKVSIVG